MEFVPFGGKDSIKLSISIVKNLVAQPTKSGALPSDNECMKFLMMAQARRLNPFEGDAFMLGYDTQDGPKFSLITAHQAFLKRAQVNPDFDGMESGVVVVRDGAEIEIEGDYTRDTDRLMGGWAKVFFKSRSKPIYKKVRLSRFKKETKIWREDPAGMICKCAEADAMRTAFPTMLGGFYLKEEMDTAHTERKAISKPIFGNEPVVELPRNSEVETPLPTQTEIVAESSDENTEKIRLLCLREDIAESTLIAYMAGMGLADMGDSIERTNTKFPKAMSEIVKRWDDVVADLKKESEV